MKSVTFFGNIESVVHILPDFITTFFLQGSLASSLDSESLACVEIVMIGAFRSLLVHDALPLSDKSCIAAAQALNR